MAKFVRPFRIAPVLVLAVLIATVVFYSAQRIDKKDTIFVSIGSYRDNECASTLVDLFRSARKPENVFAGVVTYTAAGNASAAEHCESEELAPFERNIRRLSLEHLAGRGPNLARYHGASLYGGQEYLLQIDSHMVFVAGWDAELLRMIRATPSRKAVITHYPPSRDNPGETKVPVMCMAKWLPEGVLSFEAALLDQPSANSFRPVPFVAGGFLFAPASVIREVPFDPTLDFLFHGEEELYSARLWTSGWQPYTPDRNVAFHHYGRQGAPKFWDDFGGDPSYHSSLAANVQKVVELMDGKYDQKYKYGMGRQRTVQQWWEYTGLNPADKTRPADGKRFCFNQQYVYGASVPYTGPPRWWVHGLV